MRKSPYRRFFHTLANDTRLTILHFLALEGPKCVRDIVEATGLQQSTVSVNLQPLLRCQFVHVQQNGKEHCYSLNRETIGPLLGLLDRHVRRYCVRACAACTAPGLLSVRRRR